VAKKVTAVVCGVSWAVFGVSFIFSDPPGTLTDTGVVLSMTGMMIGIFSLIALAVLALIDYARRPR
jgi:hypothetical protein